MRTLIGILLATALTLAVNALGPAPTASAHQQFHSSECGPAWCHLHTRYYDFLNETNDNPSIWGETRDAQLNWHNNVRLRFDSTSSHDASRIHAIDANYYPSTWYGAAEVCYHCGHRHTRINSYWMLGPYEQQWTACQEIGHVVGEAHHYTGDCMSDNASLGYAATINSHTINDINSYYANTGH
jgi:hypothetical protein